jgi:hypothetical protein
MLRNEIAAIWRLSMSIEADFFERPNGAGVINKVTLKKAGRKVGTRLHYKQKHCH